jgi:chromosome partitioning protein
MPGGQKNGVKLQSAVTIWNDSGGVGKTTTTVNVAETLARRGEDTLVIDLDPQYGGLTDHAGYEAALDHPQYDITDVLLNGSRTIDELVISEDGSDGLSWDLIPAHKSLEEFDGKLTATLGPKEHRLLPLRKSIEEAALHEKYNYILVDCRASRGPLVANAIAATLNVLIPTELSRKGSTAVDGLVDYVQNLQRKLRGSSEFPDTLKTGVTAIIPNNAAKTGQLTNSEKEALNYLLQEHRGLMPQFYVPSRAVLQDAWTQQMPLAEFVEEDEGRELRPNEKDLPLMFGKIAEMVACGGVANVDDSEVSNISDTVRPSDGQAQPVGGAQ